MADIVDADTRSRMMAAIGNKNTKPELQLRQALHALGFRFRLHDSRLPGRPDIILPRYHAVVFVHGCFWHRHPNCRCATTPAARREFWLEKFATNVERDERVRGQLLEKGWRIAVVWECALKARELKVVAQRLAEWLGSGEIETTIG